jgi:hypothetical protein
MSNNAFLYEGLRHKTFYGRKNDLAWLSLTDRRRYDTQHNDTLHKGLISDIQQNDTQHNDAQHYDTQHKGLLSDIQHNDTQHTDTATMLNVIVLSVAIYLLLC